MEGSRGAGTQISEGAVSLRGTKRLILGVQGHWNPELNVTITRAMLRRPGSDWKELVLSLPPAVQDSSAPCW